MRRHKGKSAWRSLNSKKTNANKCACLPLAGGRGNKVTPSPPQSMPVAGDRGRQPMSKMASDVSIDFSTADDHPRPPGPSTGAWPSSKAGVAGDRGHRLTLSHLAHDERLRLSLVEQTLRRQSHRYKSRAVQIHPTGGQFDFARPSARTPHGVYV